MPFIKGVFGFQYINPVDKDGYERNFGFTRFESCKTEANCPPGFPSPNESICEYNNSMANLAEAYGGSVHPDMRSC